MNNVVVAALGQRLLCSMAVIFCMVLFTTCSNKRVDSESNLNSVQEEEIKMVIDKFALTEENKDSQNHSELFYSDSAVINFLLVNHENPAVVSLSRDQWIGVFTKWDYDYFVKYTDFQFYIENGVVVDKHLFHGFKNDSADISGTDLFMFIRTSGGWRISGISSTIFNANDRNNKNLHATESNPREAILDLQNAVNKNDADAFGKSFISERSSCLMLISTDAHARKKEMPLEFHRNNLCDLDVTEIEFTNIAIDTYDHVLAVANSDYTIIYRDGIRERGRMLAMLMASMNDEWNVSGMVLARSGSQIESSK